MSTSDPIAIARALVEAIGSGAEPEAILPLFAEDVAFEFPGDTSTFPWVGRFTGRSGMANLLDGLHKVVILERFSVQDILVNATRAVVLGELACRVVATGKLIETPFAIALTVSSGQISGFLMLENSFAASVAAKS